MTNRESAWSAKVRKEVEKYLSLFLVSPPDFKSSTFRISSRTINCYIGKPSKLAEVVAIVIRILEVSGCNLCQDTDHPD
jgi:hypothetical protein